MSSFVPGVRVSIYARYFDVPGEPSWSKANFGSKTARMYGTILQVVGRGRYLVKWDFDGEKKEHSRQSLRIELLTPPIAADLSASEEDSDVSSAIRSADRLTDDESDIDSTPEDSVPVSNGDVATASASGAVCVGGTTWRPKGAHVVDQRSEPKEPMRVLGGWIESSTPTATAATELFLHLFPVSMVTLVTYINIAAVTARAASWIAVDVGEIMIFLGILFTVGLTGGTFSLCSF